MNTFRRSDRSSVSSHTSRDRVQSFSHSHHLSSMSPQDSDDEKGGTATRKRIALACSRCRKRKIKCSGDLGHGQCQNCKNAGSDPSSCQFLRVNSSTTFYTPQVAWPCGGSGSSISTSSMAKFGSNTGQFSPAASGLVNHSGNTYASTQFSGQSSFNHHVPVPLLAAPSRQPYGSNYSNTFNDDLIDSYTVSGAPYLLPGQDFASSYQAQDMSRSSWRPSNNNPSVEQDATMRYGPSFSYYNSSASSASSVMTDGSGPFPGLGSLVTSLPFHANSASRTLPNPTSKRGSIPSITNVGFGALHDSTLSFGVPQSVGGKSSVPWSNENVAGSSAQGAINLAEGTNGKPSSPASTTRDSNAFGYFPMSQTPMSMSSPHASEYLPVGLSESSHSDSQLGSTDAMYQSRASGDTVISSQSPSSNLYSYSVVHSARYGSTADSLVSEGMLTNGQPYTRLRQPEPHHVPSLDPLRGNSLDPNSRHVQVSSIGSSSSRHY